MPEKNIVKINITIEKDDDRCHILIEGGEHGESEYRGEFKMDFPLSKKDRPNIFLLKKSLLEYIDKILGLESSINIETI